jgi:hypothetical protein
MAPDNASPLHEPITLRPSSRPRFSMPLRLVVLDAVDAQHSTTSCHHLTTAPKMIPQEVERRKKKRHHRPIWETHIWGSPIAIQAVVVGDNKSDASIR